MDRARVTHTQHTALLFSEVMMPVIVFLESCNFLLSDQAGMDSIRKLETSWAGNTTVNYLYKWEVPTDLFTYDIEGQFNHGLSEKSSVDDDEGV